MNDAEQMERIRELAEDYSRGGRLTAWESDWFTDNVAHLQTVEELGGGAEFVFTDSRQKEIADEILDKLEG